MIEQARSLFRDEFPNQGYAKFMYVIGNIDSTAEEVDYAVAFKFVYKTLYWSGHVSIEKVKKRIYVIEYGESKIPYGSDS